MLFSFSSFANIYQTEALKVISDIENNSICRFDPSFNWSAYKEKLPNRIKSITTEDDFFDFLNSVLIDLNDSHSFVISAQQQKKMLNNPSSIIKEKPSIRVENGIGIITMPTIYPHDMNDVFMSNIVEVFQNQLKAEVDKVKTGWIIDLTKNTGGSYFPMVGALSQFITYKNIGGFYLQEQGKNYSQHVYFENGNLSFGDEPIAHSYPISAISNFPKLPIVVLIGSETASSGEFVALTLKRQPNVTLLGTRTSGIANVNQYMEINKDIGGYYMLTVGYYLDHNDTPLKSCFISPDIEYTGANDDLLNNAKKLILTGSIEEKKRSKIKY